MFVDRVFVVVLTAPLRLRPCCLLLDGDDTSLGPSTSTRTSSFALLRWCWRQGLDLYVDRLELVSCRALGVFVVVGPVIHRRIGAQDVRRAWHLHHVLQVQCWKRRVAVPKYAATYRAQDRAAALEGFSVWRVRPLLQVTPRQPSRCQRVIVG